MEHPFWDAVWLQAFFLGVFVMMVASFGPDQFPTITFHYLNQLT
jgi:hypothetical protein